MLTEMKNNPGRFKGKRILYVHTGTRLIYASDINCNLARFTKGLLNINIRFANYSQLTVSNEIDFSCPSHRFMKPSNVFQK